ncbi:MAG: DeoR/GlpR family DNA-binding transcription regulator [Blautia sp.]|nr:DeoR/GlpR family DNA-binding transcription regulator [Blautia sp.]
MLTEERFSKILSIIETRGSATVQELMAELEASESTVRRDLNAMDGNGLVTKVHGGAIAKRQKIHSHDENLTSRQMLNAEEKRAIGRYAAALIEDGDFVYIDAGTTTGMMLEYITAEHVVCVTNAVGHARSLAERGYRVYILGGEFKSATEAIVGEEALEALDKYNFTRGFFGTNGISTAKGFSTPEVREAMVKKRAMENCKERYILADHTKFEQLSSVKFAEFEQAAVITEGPLPPSLKRYNNIMEVR